MERNPEKTYVVEIHEEDLTAILQLGWNFCTKAVSQDSEDSFRVIVRNKEKHELQTGKKKK